MKYNVKVISDIHMGKGDSKKLWNELQEEFVKTIDESLDLLVIAGDLFDRVLKMNEPASKYVFGLVDQLINYSKLYDFKIRLLKGTKSHDFNQLDHFTKYDTGDDRFMVINSVCVEELDGLDILYIPEEYVEDPDIYYKDFFDCGDIYDLIFFHGTMDFAGYTSHLSSNRNIKQSPTFKSSKIASLSYGPIVGGHIHIRDNYKNKIYYTGSFSRTCFGEPEKKGFISYTYDTNLKTFDLEYINNKLAPEYMTINLSDLEGSLEEKLSQIEALKEAYDNIRIDIKEKDKKGNETIINAIKEITGDSVKLNVSNSFEESYDSRFDFIINRTLPLDETIKKFISITKGKEVSKDIINKIITEDDE